LLLIKPVGRVFPSPEEFNGLGGLATRDCKQDKPDKGELFNKSLPNAPIPNPLSSVSMLSYRLEA